ncbi:MAG: tyrosine-type recombinase/integrase [Solirubrobacteraceae bacterium]
MAKRTTPGIEVRHGRGCPTLTDADARCKCAPAYRAWAYDRRSGAKVRRSFPTLAAAKQWRADAIGEVRRGKLKAIATPTLRDAAEAWLKGARDGSIRLRSGDPFKPSAIRGYAAALDRRLIPEFGARRLSDIGRVDLQDFADRLLADGLDPSTIRNAIMPMRAIYRRAMSRGEVAVNPTAGLELPAVRGTRERVADPVEAARLLDAVPAQDRPIWATAMYAGLRRGELMALRWQDVDLAAGLIRVERSWDPAHGAAIEPKSRAGKRNVPIAAVLRDHLVEHRMGCAWTEGLVFGRTATAPFTDTAVLRRARRTWQAAGLEPIGLHEARHTFASLMIAAGVNAKALST